MDRVGAAPHRAVQPDSAAGGHTPRFPVKISAF